VHQNAKSDYKRLYDRYRQDDPIRKMYRTARWKATRQAVIKRDILCKICGHKAATVVDHIEPARIIVSTLGVDAFFEIDRLQALCSECHNVKTIGESHWAGSHK
jgi:5-methylcytosine-specific restriction endonuclease McrA